LDEFPQFVNVLLGDMSVIGPRPHLLEHDEQFAKIVNTYYTRHFVKPGITGLAQCQGCRGEIANPSLLEKRIQFDMEYIRRWSFALDLRILLKTTWQVLFPPQSAGSLSVRKWPAISANATSSSRRMAMADSCCAVAFKSSPASASWWRRMS
jgi:hypothetical protein